MGLGSLSFKKAFGGVVSGFGDAILPGAGSFVSGAVGLGEDELNAQYQAELNEKAADKEFARNLQMWNLANAYNDPSAQMERLKKAGLNPNLVYGGGNVTGNTSGSVPDYRLSGVKYNDTRVQREQLQLALAEHHQRITNQAIENDLARQRLVLAERDADRSDALAQAQIGALKAGLGLTNAKINDIAWSHEQPKTFWGKVVQDAAQGLSKVPTPDVNYTKAAHDRFIANRIAKSKKQRYIKGFNK